jgi:hypothetical protein
VRRVGRDGGLQNFELHGLVMLRISDEKSGRIRVQLENKDTRGIQLQVRQYKSVSGLFVCLFGFFSICYVPLYLPSIYKNRLFKGRRFHIFYSTEFCCFY